MQSDVLRAKAEVRFHSLQKKPTTSINEHIDEFTKLQEDVEYHALPGTKPMSTAQVNLVFLRSLGDKFEIYQQALGDKANSMSTSELFVRIKAIVVSKGNSTEKSESPPENAKALESRISEDHERGGYR